jgi:hypothetical protein
MGEFAGLVLFAFVIGVAIGLAFGICYISFICATEHCNRVTPLAVQESEV